MQSRIHVSDGTSLLRLALTAELQRRLGASFSLIFAPIDLADLTAGQLHIVSESEESNRPSGRPWRAAEASGDAKDFSERTDPSIYACRGRDAFQLAGVVKGTRPKVRSLGDPLLLALRSSAVPWRTATPWVRGRSSERSQKTRAPWGKSPSSPRRELSLM